MNMSKAQKDLVNLIDKDESKELIEFKKNLIEKNVDLNENNVKYDDEYKAFMVAKIIPTSEFFHHRMDNTDKAIENLSIQTNESIMLLRTDMDKKFEKTDESIRDLRFDMDKKFDRVDDKFDKLYGILELRDIETRKIMSDISKENREFIKTLQGNLESNAKEQRSFTLKMFGLTVTAFGIGLALVKSGILD